MEGFDVPKMSYGSIVVVLLDVKSEPHLRLSAMDPDSEASITLRHGVAIDIMVA